MPTYADPARTGFPPIEQASPTRVQHAGQAVLLAVSPPTARGTLALAAAVRGEWARRELDRSSPLAADLFETTDGDWPTAPGFHVWSGSIFAEPADPRGPVEWVGRWRRAGARDFARFGLPLPASTG